MKDRWTEDEVLAFWSRERIYEKARKLGKKKNFYFMDGPPYATGHIHMGTALNKVLKDAVMRAKRLQGYEVFDRPGYDTHGVPIEFQVEKEIGSRGKQDIEKFGVKKFIDRCKEFATQHIDVMNKEFQNLGIWMDWDNPYLTLSDEFIEAIWHVFKRADEKKLLYLGKYPVHACTRCETTVAYNEIEYGKQKDKSAYVKFPLNGKKDTYLLIWTTTPWTLPANTGVMMHPDVNYQEVQVDNEKLIMAESRVEAVMKKIGKPFKIVKTFKGEKLEGLRYTNPLASHLALDLKNSYRVVSAPRYVTTEDGTGLVHCAPGHGKEDYDIGKENGLDMPCPVGINGILTEEAGKYAGKKARVVDEEILEDLKKSGNLACVEMYEHDYPLCWRDRTPLLMISQPQWFFKISDIHKKLLDSNDEIHWVPDYMKLRMRAWLEGIGDWPVSRQRYWGTPLPIWENEETGEKIVVGSIAELEKLSGKKIKDLHKPGIDSITIKGKTGILKRTPGVLDVWFDSGVTSWAALGYPKDTKSFKKFWPANVNIEGKDQFRGWWNSQLILSEIEFGKKPLEKAMVHGMILDISKRKMSKSTGNIISPDDIIKKYGRDYLRYYLVKSSKGEDFAFNENDFKDVQSFFRVLLNVHTFINQLEKGKSRKSIEDDWILSRFYNLVGQVTEKYDQLKMYEALSLIERFLIDDFSRNYIQMIRDRSGEVFKVMHEIRIGLLALVAPVAPFITESIWQELRERGEVKEESVHLSSWPSDKKSNEKLEGEFKIALEIIERGLAERDKLKIGLRWPLAKATYFSNSDISEQVEEIVAKQLNVKKIVRKNSTESLKVELDTTTSRELEAEGFAREVARRVQAERKTRGLEKKDRIKLEVYTDEELKEMLSGWIEFLEERTGSEIKFAEHRRESHVEFEVKNRKICFSF